MIKSVVDIVVSLTILLGSSGYALKSVHDEVKMLTPKNISFMFVKDKKADCGASSVL